MPSIEHEKQIDPCKFTTIKFIVTLRMMMKNKSRKKIDLTLPNNHKNRIMYVSNLIDNSDKTKLQNARVVDIQVMNEISFDLYHVQYEMRE